jgi:saccharopine dehydrogenase-like NADP-dependent oxidoreductase
MKKIIVLGAGMVGSAIAIDLSKKYEVTSVDLNSAALEKLSSNYKIKAVKADITDETQLTQLLNNYDLVVSAVPGFLGYQTMVNVIKRGKDLVDISFLAEDVLPLDN